MADGHTTAILDRYWQALQSGAPNEAQSLRDEINEQYASLQASLDLLDELLDAQAVLRGEHPGETTENGADA
jgi:hypothetical protein